MAVKTPQENCAQNEGKDADARPHRAGKVHRPHRYRREGRRNRRWGELAKLVIQISGRSKATVYAVLNGKMTSEPIERAIEEARTQLRARVKRRAA